MALTPVLALVWSPSHRAGVCKCFVFEVSVFLACFGKYFFSRDLSHHVCLGEGMGEKRESGDETNKKRMFCTLNGIFELVFEVRC